MASTILNGRQSLPRRSARLAALAASCIEKASVEKVHGDTTKGRKKNRKSMKPPGHCGTDKCPELDMPSEILRESWKVNTESAVHASIGEKLQKVKHIGVKLSKAFPTRELEAKLWEMGYQHVAGVDEAGRGPLAGPVVAAACIIPSTVFIEGINDSKKLSEMKRDELYTEITSTPGIIYAVHVVDVTTIDEINILEATMQAMAACVKKLCAGSNNDRIPDYILVDGNRLPVELSEEKARCVVKGDTLCHVIAAASILAKVTRDRLMVNYDKTWPQYGFKAHKGYGTVAHMAALKKHGPCEIHRRTFAPVKDYF